MVSIPVMLDGNKSLVLKYVIAGVQTPYYTVTPYTPISGAWIGQCLICSFEWVEWSLSTTQAILENHVKTIHRL